MQGLGTGSISLFGSEELKRKYLPPVRDGKAIAAFALSEPEAGSDVAALATTAKADGAHVRLDGEKTWISNGGIADHYVVFARTGEAPGARGLSAFVVDADTPGLTVAERIEVIAPHPLARLHVRRRARAGGEPAGQARRGVQGGDGDARHLPLDGRRRGAGLRPPRAARDGRARRDAQAVRRAARRSADDAGRPSPTARPRSMPRRCWSIAPPGSRIRAPSASPARRRWPRCSRPKPPSA